MILRGAFPRNMPSSRRATLTCRTCCRPAWDVHTSAVIPHRLLSRPGDHVPCRPRPGPSQRASPPDPRRMAMPPHLPSTPLRPRSRSGRPVAPVEGPGQHPGLPTHPKPFRSPPSASHPGEQAPSARHGRLRRMRAVLSRSPAPASWRARLMIVRYGRPLGRTFI